jgi:type I restriction enzyme S subunit
VQFDDRLVHARFGAYALKRLEPYIRGIAPNTTLPILAQTDIADLRLAVPPVSEQLVITTYLDRIGGKVAVLRERATQMINRLRERRSALITAAVTGQLDVTEPTLTVAAV